MSTPPKFGIVVTQPTAFIERNPDFVAHVRRNMERDIRDSGCLIDDESWKREELPDSGFGKPMTRFTLDAVAEAHVIVHITKEGRYTSTEVVEVQIGTRDAAWARAKALDEERGHDEWDYHAIESAPLGYAPPKVQVTQEFPEEGAREALIRASRWDRR